MGLRGENCLILRTIFRHCCENFFLLVQRNILRIKTLQNLFCCFISFRTVSEKCSDFWAEIFWHGCQRCFQRIQMVILSWGNFLTTFQPSRIRSRKSSTMKTFFSELFSKLHFAPPEQPFDFFIESFSNFVSYFEICVKNVWEFSAECSAWLSKLHLTGIIEQFVENWFLKKHFSVSFTFGVSGKILTFGGGNWHGSRNCFLHVQRVMLGKNRLRGWNKNCFFFWNLNLKFPKFGKNFLHSCLNSIIHVQMKILSKIWCLKFSLTYFFLFLDFKQKKIGLSGKILSLFSRTDLYVYRGSFQGKTNLSKKQVFCYHRWISSVNFWSLAKIPCTFVKTAFCVFRGSSRREWSYLPKKEHFFSKSFWNLIRKNFDLWAQLFFTAVKTSFHAYREMFLAKNGSCKNWLMFEFFMDFTQKSSDFWMKFYDRVVRVALYVYN